MDGIEKRLKRFNESLQFKLSFSLCVVLLTAATLAGLFAFSTAFDEARELQDGTLRQVATLFERHGLGSMPSSALSSDTHTLEASDDSRVFVQLLSAGSLASARDTVPLPETLTEGFQTIQVGDEPYRVLVKTMSAGPRLAVLQEADQRDEIAYGSAFRTVLPLLILVPIFLLVIAQLVQKVFEPIASISSELDRRTERELHAVTETNLPVEVRPFAVAINHLLVRVSQSMSAQQRFIADAAHELRSPLTALSLQAERMADAEMSFSARERLETLRLGIARGQRLLNQLLTFARAQTTPDLPVVAVSTQHLFRQVLEDLMPLAEDRRIDVGIDSENDVLVHMQVEDISIIMRNLVENAIRYTPEEGRVDLSVVVETDFVCLFVKDSGPGIAPRERSRVFEPFYRTLGSGQPGSGLGLAIAQTIASRWNSQITLNYNDEVTCTGLSACLKIPVTASDFLS